jgi:frataxin-like iron-binding protein CyaY
MIKVLIFIISILLLFISCTDNPIDNQSDNTFNVEIRVVDSVGNPIPNIKVSIWNKVNNLTNLNKVNSHNEINAYTTIGYTIVQQCYVNLILYDLNNEIFKELVSGQYQAGAYEVGWSTLLANGVYKCILSTSSDSLHSSVLFKDSIYVSLISPDPSISLIGITDSEGSIKVKDKLLFPHLFNLPSIPRTLESGPEIVGYFDYSDSVVIALSNESFSKTVTFNHLVVDGKNKFKFTLDNNFLNIEKNLKSNDNQSEIDFELKNNVLGTDTASITSFTASINNQDVILHWETSNELNNQGFEIERNYSGNQAWVTVGFVSGFGTITEPRSYSFRDQNLYPGTYKYRLKQIDFDGSFSFSEEIEVDLVAPLAWKLYQNYPNPFN